MIIRNNIWDKGEQNNKIGHPMEKKWIDDVDAINEQTMAFNFNDCGP